MRRRRAGRPFRCGLIPLLPRVAAVDARLAVPVGRAEEEHPEQVVAGQLTRVEVPRGAVRQEAQLRPGRAEHRPIT